MSKTRRNKGLGFPVTAAERAAWLHSMTPADGSPHPYGDDWADPITAEILADALWGDEEPPRGRSTAVRVADGLLRCVRCGARRAPDQFEPKRSICSTCRRRLDEAQSKTAQNRVRDAIKAGRVDKLLKKHQPILTADRRTLASWDLPGGRYSARQERRLEAISAREWLVRWLLDPEMVHQALRSPSMMPPVMVE